MTFYLLGESDHSVLDTIAQLTEGRSARDQPKQPPAKKSKTQQDFADLHSSELQPYTPKQLKNSATKRFSGKTISAASLVAAAQFTCFLPVCFVGL